MRGNSSRSHSQTLHVSLTLPPLFSHSIPTSLSHSDPNLRPTPMATTPLGSALTASPSDSDKARHLLALLLSLGRPTRPSELAARCSAFPATAHLVQRLCSVANSPLSLSDDLFVTPSLFAGGALSTDSGKRKRFVLDCGFVPSVKRRLIADFENGKSLLSPCLKLINYFCLIN